MPDSPEVQLTARHVAAICFRYRDRGRVSSPPSWSLGETFCVYTSCQSLYAISRFVVLAYLFCLDNERRIWWLAAEFEDERVLSLMSDPHIIVLWFRVKLERRRSDHG